MPEWAEGLVAILTGIALRVGLPIGVTALATWALRRLDRRWQEEAGAVGSSPAPAAVMGARCWEVRGCSESERADCPADARPETPCWQVFREIEGRLPERCLDCEIFREAPVPAEAST
ncbi:MAG TPA: hypothetical protein VGA32_03730 [Anaerolineales bacterium]